MAGFSGGLRLSPTGRHAPDHRIIGPGNPIYALAEPLTYECRQRVPRLARALGRIPRRVDVPAGYETDLASIPKHFQHREPHLSPAARPGVVHDFLYTSHAVKRRVADRIFREALREEGVGLRQRIMMWAAVRALGGGAYRARLGWAP